MRTYVDEAAKLRHGQMVMISDSDTKYMGEVKSVRRTPNGCLVTLYADGSIWYENYGSPVPMDSEPTILVTPVVRVFPQ